MLIYAHRFSVIAHHHNVAVMPRRVAARGNEVTVVSTSTLARYWCDFKDARLSSSALPPTPEAHVLPIPIMMFRCYAHKQTTHTNPTLLRLHKRALAKTRAGPGVKHEGARGGEA